MSGSVGEPVGEMGASVISFEGEAVGIGLGCDEGSNDGSDDGTSDGADEGSTVRMLDGEDDG